MVEEFKKKDKDMILINQHMHSTFALRRQEIVQSGAPIADFKERWPALFLEAQLYGEFHRITNQNLQLSIFSGVDKHTPRLLTVYKQMKSGAFAGKMTDILTAYEEQDKNDICAARSVVLAGLPLYFKEDSSEIFKTCKEDELERFQEGPVAIVAVVDKEEQVAAGVPFKPRYVSIVLEDQVVMSVRTWPDALVVLYGLVYALHLSYPKKLKTFFDFIQIVLLSLDDGKQLKPKLQTLKNELEQ